LLGLMPKLLHDFVETRADSATIAEVNALAGIPRERRYRIDAEYDESEFHVLLRAATNGAVAVINEVIAEAEEDERLEALSEVEEKPDHQPKPPLDLGRSVVAVDEESEGPAQP